ncbi:MAG: hypothetical protein HON53_04600 [Planctomycetaceae bacterium]|jgi:CxxC motif-containing protein (DUF1111 family)|nr:hypothetical protein [Planctomycetaceae bacterium]MBT6496036.1 hypothetical protein [Planctomycetaceae bacterium]
MKLRTQFRMGSVAVALLTLLGGLQLFAADEKPKKTIDRAAQLAEGKMLFERDWSTAGPLKGARGDGLGPMYNDVSCVACHNLGGVGGAGPNKNNVNLLSRGRRPVTKVSTRRRSRSSKQFGKVHPGFGTGSSTLILHQFGEGPVGSAGDYEKWRNSLLGEGKYRLSLVHPLRRIQRVWLQLTQRNTPALFGAGIIDSIPDSLLIETAEIQEKQFPEISGRVPQTGTGAVGRFGWRGQTGTLHEFVLGACAVELGLQVPGNTIQTKYPLKRGQEGDIRVREPFKVRDPRLGGGTDTDLDLTDEQCKSLTAYCASLSAPVPVAGAHLQVSLDVYKGHKLFNKIGCAACHVKDMGPAKDVFSDLLLHDMGKKLADPLPATPEITDETAPSFSSSYYGESAIEFLATITTNIRQEWRTPPLWGVRDSAPYMHDGRAYSLETAIRMHEGEASRSGKRFRALTSKQREQLLTFLNSLAAPGGGPVSRRFGRSGFGAGFFSTPVELED